MSLFVIMSDPDHDMDLIDDAQYLWLKEALNQHEEEFDKSYKQLALFLSATDVGTYKNYYGYSRQNIRFVNLGKELYQVLNVKYTEWKEKVDQVLQAAGKSLPQDVLMAGQGPEIGTGSFLPEDSAAKTELNACLNALVNAVGIPHEYWTRWLTVMYAFSKYFNNLQVMYYPAEPQLVGPGTFEKMAEMEGGLKRGCILLENRDGPAGAPRLAAECFRNGSVQKGGDDRLWVAVNDKWSMVKTDSDTENAYRALRSPDMMNLTGGLKQNTFAEVVKALNSAEPRTLLRQPGEITAAEREAWSLQARTT